MRRPSRTSSSTCSSTRSAAPNSPQWFNTGLNWAYGISGPAQGHWIVNPETGEPELADDAYTNPQPHACFIQSIDDSLVSEGGIMDLWMREARLFKYGSGTGTNFSNLRAENELLSGGGKSSGLMSWLKIGDRAAGAIKSGGTTRRAAKMVCLDMDHPDIESFVNWKVREEIKVAALVEGLKKIGNEKTSESDTETIGHTADRLGLKLDYDFNGEAYSTVSGQNSNNSVRIPDAFFDAVDEGSEWATYYRTTGEVAKTYDAAQALGRHRLRRVAVRRPRRAVRQHDQRVAHLPGRRADQRVQPVQRVHVPRQHGVQPRVAQRDQVLQPRDA